MLGIKHSVFLCRSNRPVANRELKFTPASTGLNVNKNLIMDVIIMKRKIIKIDEEKCTGCGLCIPDCPEGALQVIDGKARLISDLFCDGLGACIGTCPEGAIEVEEREAEEYDEWRVMENVVKQGQNVIKAHLKHLKDHKQDEFLSQAIDFLKTNKLDIPDEYKDKKQLQHPLPQMGCPGAMMMDFGKSGEKGEKQAFTGCPGAMMRDLASNDEAIPAVSNTVTQKSQLRQWPVQLQLLNPQAPYFKNAHLLIAADCVPFTYHNFHQRFLKDKILVVFCPKLDKTIQEYVEKLAEIFKTQNIQSVTLVHMEVPCCFGLERVVQKALQIAGKNIIIKDYTISVRGEIV